MPQLIFKGVTQQTMEKLAPTLVEQLSQILQCPQDWLTLELCPSLFYGGQGQTEHYPVVQVWWYQRPRAVQQAVSKLLGDRLLAEGYPLVQVSFHLFAKEDYDEWE